MRRVSVLLVVLVLIAAACGDDGATAETGVTTEPAGTEQTSTTDTRPPAERAPGPAFILPGEIGAYVTALQTYLDCAGFGLLAFDGVFGDATLAAVENAQTSEGKTATGEPDEETFALASRSCSRERSVPFAAGAASTEVAGNVASGDDEAFNLGMLEGQEMTIRVMEGAVQVAIQGEDGAVLQRPGSSTEIVVIIPTSQTYVVRVSAPVPTSYLLTISIPGFEPVATTTTSAGAAEFFLASDGFNVVDFGAEPESTIDALFGVLGPFDQDTGWFTAEEFCTVAANVRVVTWVFLGNSEGEKSTTLTVEFNDLYTENALFSYWEYALTFGVGDIAPESGQLSTSYGLSPGDTYNEAVGYGLVMQGFEEASQGSVGGIRVRVFSATDGSLEVDGEVSSMEAGESYCIFEGEG